METLLLLVSQPSQLLQWPRPVSHVCQETTRRSCIAKVSVFEEQARKLRNYDSSSSLAYDTINVAPKLSGNLLGVGGLQMVVLE